MVSVPFDPDLDLIYITAKLRGPRGEREFTLALDTACGMTLITPECLDHIGYSARDGESIAFVTSALGREAGYILHVREFKALGHARSDFHVNVHDLPEDCGIDGLLGLNFLRHLNYEIRSKEGRILVGPA